MNEQDNLNSVKKIYDAFKHGDIQTILNMLTDDVDWYVPGPPSDIPFAGHRHGKAQVQEFFNSIEETQEVKKFEVKKLVAQGDTVAGIIDFECRIKQNGNILGSDIAHFFTFRDGKVSNFQQFDDTLLTEMAYVSEPVYMVEVE